MLPLGTHFSFVQARFLFFFFGISGFCPEVLLFVWDLWLLFTFATMQSIKCCIGPKKSIEILMNLHILRHADSKKLIFGMSSVCLSVCLSVDASTQKIIELAQPNLVCNRI